MQEITLTKSPDIHLLSLTRLSDNKQWYIGYCTEHGRWTFIKEWVNERRGYMFEDTTNLNAVIVRNRGELYSITSHVMGHKIEFFLPVESAGGLR